MSNNHWIQELCRLDACAEAVEYAENHATLEAAWRECRRGDWMLWLLARTGAKREDLVLAACSCARLALPFVTDGEDRPLRAIEAAEEWARQPSAEAAPRAAEAAEAARAAWAAARAAWAAEAAEAAARAARDEALARCAGFVRERFPVAPVLAVEKGGRP